VVTNEWTGDASLLAGEQAWILLRAFELEEYRAAARALRSLLAEPAAAAASARSLAVRHFSLDEAVSRYDELYRQTLVS
jgi:hypothetical protein